MSDRDFDLVLFGATGFVGKIAAARLKARAPEGFRLGLAGRSEAKLRPIARALGLDDDDVVVADAFDKDALAALCARTTAVMSTVGPFADYGTPLFEACVNAGTHYADITGETPWARSMIEQFGEKARENGTVLVPFAGFDSVPSDLGAFSVVRELQNRGLEPAQVMSVFKVAGGGLNGGTLMSAIGMQKDKAALRVLADPFALNVEVPPASGLRKKFKENLRPRQDPEGVWRAPFFMAPVNSRIVRRSAMLFADRGGPSYGDSFAYDEVMSVGSQNAKRKAQLFTLGMGAAFAAIANPLTRPVVKKIAPSPGEGPSEAAMEKGHVRVVTFGTATTGERVKATLDIDGDAGNRATALMFCEVGLALATGALPSQSPGEGGVLTPAFALGASLEERLVDAGATFKIEDA